MGRAPCCDNNGLKKGPWTPEEDKKLIDYITKHGYGNWRTLPKNAGLQRHGKSCRLRWTNYLRPDIKRGKFSFEEAETITQLHSILGNKWSAIAARLPGRTDNEIKNYWNTHIRKQLLRMGIDPVTHGPRLDLLDLSSILSSSLYNSSQINVPKFHGGVQQPLIDQEHLRLATSLMSSPRELNHNFGLQNDQENQLCWAEVQIHQDHYQPILVEASQFQRPQEMTSCATLTSSLFVPFCGECESQLVDQHFQSDHISNFSSRSSQLSYDNWQSNGMGSNNNYYASVLATPSSSPTPLNSNSTTYINGGSSSSPEDEIESYCSNLLKFEISDILDSTDFM